MASHKGDTGVGPREARPPPATCTTAPDFRRSPPPSPRPSHGRSASPSAPAASAPHRRKRARAFTSRPTRPVRRSKRALSTSNLLASGDAPGSPHRRSMSSTNRPAKTCTIPSDGPPPPERPPTAVSGRGSVVLHPHDAENQGRWAVEHHHDGLIYEVVGARKQSKEALKRLLGITEPAPPEPRIFRVSFAEMQRLKLRKLQVKLVGHAVDMFTSKEEPDGWEGDLAQYSEREVVAVHCRT